MRPTSQVALVGAIVAIAAAVARHNGEYDALGLVFLALALLLAGASACNLRVPFIERHGEKAVRWTIAVGVVIEALLFIVQPVFSQEMPRWLVPVMAVLASVIALFFLIGPLKPGRAVVWILVGAFLLFCVVTVRAHHRFLVDVRIFQQFSAEALFRGIDPYMLRYRNIYSNPHFYGAGNLDAHGNLRVGFIYPPLIALMAIPGVLLGDVRFSHVLCMAGAAAALGLARPGRIAIGAMALFILMPRTVFFLAGGWSEPMSMVLLCWTVWAAARRKPGTTGLLAGLLVASKQYLVVIAPLFWLLTPDRRDRVRTLLVALLAALVVTVPLAFWHFDEFLNSAVGFHLRQPFRADSLSFLAAYARATGTEPSRLVNIVIILIMGALSVVLAFRCAKRPSAFALSVALVVLGLFAFSQQAFVNYFAFGYAALCAALATSAPDCLEDGGKKCQIIP